MAIGIISNIQRTSIHDGPGMRTTVFFKGCPLRCVWCHNPETYEFGRELRYKEEDCLHCGSCVSVCRTGALTIQGESLQYRKSLCAGCFACTGECPAGALAIAGTEMTVEDVLREALRDRSLYERTGGGVTLSGGECTAQYDFCLSLLRALKAEGIHTCLDTSGQCQTDRFLTLARESDLVLFDIKAMDPARHKELTGVGNEKILENFFLLGENSIPVEVRMPIVPGLNDDPEGLRLAGEAIRQNKAVQSVVLLGYHKLGLSKVYDFSRHGRDLGVTPPKKATLGEMAQMLQELTGLPVSFR